MKTFNKNFASKFALAAFLALGTLAVTSCSKDNQNGQEVPDGKNQIIVRIAGISDGEEVKTKGSNRTSSAQHNLQLVQGNGFDALIGVDNQLPVTEIATAGQSGIKAASGTRAASPVASGTKYRLFLYKKNGTSYNFEKSVELSSGTETAVNVTDGATYKWVALSYNSTTVQVPEMQNLALPGNTDVLRATNEFTVSGAAVPININFSRVFARIGIELNTMGMFAPINSATVAVTGNNAKTGTLDVATGTFVGALTDVTAALTYADFVTAPGSDGQQKIAYYYTADQTLQNLNVSVSALKIKLENGTERSFGATLSKGQEITPERGKNHRFLLGITESPLTFGGVQWSRSNLYYQAGYNPYRFYHFNQPTTDAKSFFSYGAAKPGVLGTYASPKDPCALVYPAGLWKTPAKADLDPINSNGLTGLLGDLDLNILGSTVDLLVDAQNALAANVAGATSPVGAGYSEFTATGVNAAYGTATSATNKLRFNFNGFMRDVSLVEDLITLDLGSTGGKYTAFWTNDRSLLSPLEPIAGLGVTHYLGNRYAGILGVNAGYKGFRSTNVLGITLLNSVNVIKSSLMNVRCVRNGAWNPNAAGYNPNPVLPN
ncbi:hypothetical protein OHD16_25865 [Sphingobacterium sp. ML3W]|uniref:hypothetical protein n=1 Tax=Sphingobacterium sp. ML3W TaxID=1538644 RepID=UPI00249A77AA|nr:hypothetical protein [Sphingobacterium sp. ML3W]WFA78132.1 hypothetical protein OGI71_19005 [Sphingobacterium sp. ML3W]